MKKWIFTLFTISSLTLGAQSLERSVIGSAGGSFANSSFSLDWTVGEVVTATATGGSSILTQGFQQPNTGNINVSKINTGAEVKCYPNPTQDYLNLEWMGNSATASVQMLDAAGKVVYASEWQNNNSFQINMGAFAQGIYFLTVQVGDKTTSIRVSKL